MYIIRRDLKQFGLSITFDGQRVMVVQLGGRRPNVLEVHEVKGLRDAGKEMARLEDELHTTCTACC